MKQGDVRKNKIVFNNLDAVPDGMKLIRFTTQLLGGNTKIVSYMSIAERISSTNVVKLLRSCNPGSTVEIEYGTKENGDFRIESPRSVTEHCSVDEAMAHLEDKDYYYANCSRIEVALSEGEKIVGSFVSWCVTGIADAFLRHKKNHNYWVGTENNLKVVITAV